MLKTHNFVRGGGRLAFFSYLVLCGNLHAQVQVVTQTNVTVRVMASNLTSGNNSRYESPGLNILQGLKPDIVAMQEFNVSNSFGINTTAAITNMIATTFGTNFSYFRESSTTETYSIPNGVISRYQILTNGTWDDTLIPDRGFCWAKIAIPGTNPLYVVSTHFKASAGSEATRSSEAANLKTLIQANFPSNALFIVAGDFNTQVSSTNSEPMLAIFYSYMSNVPVPTDAESGGSANTSANRSKPLDQLMVSFSFTNALTPVVLPSRIFTNGLVFDSRVYSPLSDVPPVVVTDSGALNMQHMGVVKDFKIPCLVTNIITVPSPTLAFQSTNIIRWSGISNLTYTVQARTNLAITNWLYAGMSFSSTTNFSFTNLSSENQQFFRVTYP